ncbi:hypothetical protein CDL15_Pgr003417 [Punica granatum]|uniref:Jacalin-type lectin domain-containing protein n=1 Tax=Punica granatum TaxID=22663 RepID=A0A218X220_PUNGR|nr:hypothetical protein CDL15_Pgr003417 [Punica granatum]
MVDYDQNGSLHIGGKIIGFHGTYGCSLSSIGGYFGPVSRPYPFLFVEPLGGKGGHPWNDGKYTDMRRIDFVVGSVVESITIWYDDHGCPPSPFIHGKSAAGHTCSVKLDYPYGYITSVSGYTKGESNQNSGKIVGFYGRSDNHLNSIGAHLEVYSKKLYPFKSVGLYGGSGPQTWDDGRFSHVSQIDVVVESTIRSIRFDYEKKESFIRSQFHGATDAYGKTYTIKFDSPEEYLIAISGYTGDDSGSNCIQSLKYQSNKRTYGPFGTETRRYFSLPLEGRLWDSLERVTVPILFQLEHILNQFLISTQFSPSDPSRRKRKAAVLDTDLRQMKILSGSVIVSIGIEYDNNGSPVPGSQHGVDRVYMGLNAEDKEIEPPRAAKRVKLDYPKEYLVSVSGFTGKKLSEEAVQSLTIKTNKKTYGPYGTREGYHFELPPSGGRTVGFFGRAGRFLNSIGARL